MVNNDFIPPEFLRREISEMCGDAEFKKGLSRGWYMTKIRGGLDKFAYESFFDSDKKFEAVIPTNLRIELPKNVYCPTELYVYTGQCRPENAVQVYWKQGFDNSPDGKTYTASRNESLQVEDPFKPFGLGTQIEVITTMVKWANIIDDGSGQQQILQLSSSCAGYNKIRLKYKGTYGSFCEVPCIPRILLEALLDWGCWKWNLAQANRNQDRFYLEMAQTYRNNFENSKTGTYYTALEKLNILSAWERKSWNEYISRGTW